MLFSTFASLTMLTPIVGSYVRRNALKNITYVGTGIVTHTMHKPASYQPTIIYSNTGPLYLMQQVPEENEYTINIQDDKYNDKHVVSHYKGALEKKVPIYIINNRSADDINVLKNDISNNVIFNTGAVCLCFGIITYIVS